MKRLKYILLVVLSCCLMVVPTTITTYADSNDNNIVTESANLLRYPYNFSYVPDGMEFTVLPDGGIVLNGVCSTYSVVIFSRDLDVILLTPGYYYFFSGAYSNVVLQMVLVNRSDTSMVLAYTDYGEGTSFYLDARDWSIRADFHIPPGSYDNLVFYPMLNEGQTALPYQPPVGAQKNLYGGMVSMLGDSMNNVLSAFGNSISYVTDNVFFLSTDGGVVLSEYGIITVICAGICLCLGLFKFIFNFFIKGV